MPTSFSDLELAFEFVSSSGVGMNEAFLCRRTGKIYWRSDSLDMEDMDEEIPDDIEDEEKYIRLIDPSLNHFHLRSVTSGE